ncbi:predicted protein [Plenodomus lingam JN3]|uniref:Predicted protein n=1 Tax=Leptosphaeria maculans (strain JN3 / isolate v23.1.3 / race Av1-4-5-6-7-8) TaxID=985895 RepID=E4ZZ47_LEPMJ|nr:predicted protein [Plenodomus lingam JN3]CBX96642.1 predicted protein [Plenodomus lingam JN3]
MNQGTSHNAPIAEIVGSHACMPHTQSKTQNTYFDKSRNRDHVVWAAARE